MIHIVNKEDCCGCEACVQRCPQHCIELRKDNEGFYYPYVNESQCIGCDACVKVCPELHKPPIHVPLAAYAGFCREDAIRLHSSSGGIFTLLAQQTIQEGGVVFGARWNGINEVCHDYIEKLEDISKLRGSKYLQSNIGDCFIKVKTFLKENRKVLFSGTPCQIAGLLNFLGKEDENLLTISVICHGVPSPQAWEEYVNEELTNHAWQDKEIENISFRDKTTGWNNYSITLTHKEGKNIKEYYRQNAYMRGFLSNLYTRPSCSTCPVKGKYIGDITLGDFWKIESLLPELNDDKGISAIIIHNKKGQRAINNIEINKRPVPLSAIEERNPALIHSCTLHPRHDKFFLISTTPFTQKVERLLKPTLWESINVTWFKFKTRIRNQRKK